ncbi:hypothetical protein H5976_02125 [Streptococcus alactolyticus]|uniref:YopX family protein n=1 Tax=Streptococcus alactolyticus TaxID=29389 RepID=UPI001959D4E8|nr:YopX family protein [Streptococcus alactolyticus]MBM6697528.1 hypothetical protein [Streptococcus alactolyticus]
MKPIFRAWTEEGEVMYYDAYPFKDDTLLLSYDEIAFDEVPASDFILMQSTGLKDKNGKEIYEGDIVRYECCSERYVEEVIYDDKHCNFGTIDKDEKTFSFDALISDFDVDCFEVVGNKYENPELLKGE